MEAPLYTEPAITISRGIVTPIMRALRRGASVCIMIPGRVGRWVQRSDGDIRMGGLPSTLGVITLDGGVPLDTAPSTNLLFIRRIGKDIVRPFVR